MVARYDALTADVAALDRTLAMFAPDLQPETIPPLQSRPQQDWAAKGEIARLVFAILRETGEPISTNALAIEVHRRRGLEGAPMTAHIKRLRNCLDRQKARGTIRRVVVHEVSCWEIG